MVKNFDIRELSCSRKYIAKLCVVFFFLLIGGAGTLYAQHTLSICSGASINFAPPGNASSIRYTWGVPVVSPANAVNATPQATSQTGVIQTLTNSTTATATVTYTVSATNSTTFTLVVTVFPRPILTNSVATTSICSGATFIYTSASSTAGTAITWTRAAAVGINPNTNNGNGSISEALTNTSGNPVTTTYLMSLTANGCSNTQNLSVIVNPIPTLNSTLTPADVCSGSIFSYTPSSDQSPNINFSWSRAAVAGISNAAATGTNSPDETLINTTLAPIAVSYVYTLQNTSTGCSGSQTVTVNVNPLPALSSATSNVTICSGATFNYNPTSALAGTSITWSRASVVGISPATGQSNGSVSEVLVNNSNTTAVTATYLFTLSKDGCNRNQSFTVTVNPSPALTSTLVAPNICSGNTFNYTPTSAQSPNVTFAWSRLAVAGISNIAANGTGNPGEALNNTTLLAVPVAYSYTLTNIITGCANTQNVTFSVNPIPSIAGPINVSTCNSQGFYFFPSGAPVGTTYTWPTPVISPNGAINGGAANSAGSAGVGQYLSNNTGSAATATYTVTPNTSGCIGSTFSVVVTVNIGVAPVIALNTPLTNTPICSNTPFTYTPGSNAVAPTFSWQRLYAAGISNPLASNTGNINETLINTTTLPVTVTYAVTTSSAGCSNTENVTVSVNPATQLNTTLTPAAICNSTVFTYAPGSNTPSTISYNWARAGVAGISNAATAGTGNPLETLTNTTTAPITVNYVYTLNTSGGCLNSQTVSVIVNPTAQLTSVLTATAICSGTTFNYIPTTLTAGTTYGWSRAAVPGISNAAQTGADNPAELLVNTGTTNVTVSYIYTLTANTCANTQTVTVVVKPVPVITGQTATICSGNTFTTAPTGVPVGTQYTWPLPVSVPAAVITGGATGTSLSNISQLLSNTTTDPGILYYTVTPVSNGCTGLNFTVAVTVNPIPVAANQTVAAICSGTAFTYTPPGIQTGTTYSWNSPVISPASSITGTSAQSAQTAISQTLTNLNTTASTVTYTVTPLANGCTGSNFTVTVPVSPVPVIGVQATSVCSANSFTVAPTTVPVGTTYTWAAPVNTPFGVVSGGSSQTTPALSISQILTNTSFVPAQTAYDVVPVAGSCAGGGFTVTVTVNPATALSSSLTPAAVCSNTLFSYTPTSNTPSTNVYSWTRTAVAGISNGASSGTGNPNESLINSTIAPINVVYNYSLATTAGCTRNETVTVVVNPTPVLSSSLTPAAVCSGGLITYNATSAITGTVFSWARPTLSAISNAAGAGTTNVSESLVNTSLSAIAVGYNYTLTANGCSNNQTVSISVKPLPVVAAQTATICSNASFLVAPGNTPTGTQYTWGTPVSNPLGVVNGSAAVLQNNISAILTNATVAPAVATYTVTPVANGCTGNDFILTVTVNPIPVVNDRVLASVCSGTAFNYSPTGVPTNTTYAWNNPLVTPTGGLAGGSAQGSQFTVSQTLTSSNNIANTAVYTVTPSANGCAGNSFQLTVPVSPTPSVSNQLVAICSGTAFTVNPTPVPTGTTYTWGTPVQSAFGSVSGAVAQAVAVPSISQILNNTTTASAQAVYTVTPASASCNGTPFTITVTVNPATQLNLALTATAICSNTVFNYAAASNTPGTTLQWTRAVVAGISNIAATGINNPNETLINVTNQSLNVSYVYNLSTPAGCTNTQTVTVTVKPIPVLTSVTLAPAVCSGSPLTYQPTANVTGSSFTWSRTVQAFISNVAASGTNDPAEILVNTSTNTVPVVYNYTVLANGCSSQQAITIPVNPTPNIANQTQTICSNSSFSFASTTVPTGTQYTWGTPVYTPTGSITGGSAQVVAQAAVSQQLTSQTLVSGVATYTVIASAGGCSGVPFTVAVTVQPVPAIANQTISPVCSGIAFSYTPALVPANTTYTWSNPVIAPQNTLSGGSAQSVSQTVIGQTLVSTNNVMNTAVYTVTPVAGACTGNIFTVTVPVNPTPVVVDIRDTICTGSTFAVVPSPTPINTRYTWGSPTIQPFGSVLGSSAQVLPSGNISQTLINTTSAPARLTYIITPVSGTCTGIPFALMVSVGSTMPAIADQTAQICSGTAFNTNPVNAPVGTTYTWALPVTNPLGSVSGISNAAFPQTAVSQVLTNGTAINGVATYTVVAKNTGCISNTFRSVVTVLPTPRVTITGNPVICRYPFDTLSLDFTGTAQWSFTYAEDNNAPRNITGINTSPYRLILPASAQTQRRFMFTNIAFGSCLNTVDTTFFTQLINPLPTATINSQRGIYLCNNIPDTLFITSPDSLGYRWQLNGAELTGFTDDSLVTGVPGRYNASITNKFGCVDTIAQPITLYKVNQPVLRLLYDTYCVNLPLNLTNITDTNTTGPINWKWDFGDGKTQNTYHGSNVFTTGGNHHIQLIATQVYCPATPTTLDTTIDLQIPIPGVTMPSVSAYKTVPTPVSVRTIAGYRYQWTPSRGIDFSTRPDVRFDYTTTQQYVINLISPAGCITYDSLLIRVFDDKLVDIFLPKSFTPNNDGVNDKLFPYLTGVKEFKYFKIFNRYNQLMFESKNYDDGWNGALNGTPQPMGIYIWVAVGIANDGSMVQKTGQTLLLR